MYYKHDLLKITTVLLEREEAKEFFSIFENIQPKLEQMWIHLTQSQTIFQSIDEKSIEKIFYEGSNTDRLAFKRNLFKEFLGEEDQVYSTKRVSVIFGYDKRELPYHMKLVYYHDARGLGNGYLRLHFTYKTYENGKVNHLMPWQIYENKQKKKTKGSSSEDNIQVNENHFEKRRRTEEYVPDEEELRELELIEETMKRHEKQFYMGQITPEYQKELYSGIVEKFGLNKKDI